MNNNGGNHNRELGKLNWNIPLNKNPGEMNEMNTMENVIFEPKGISQDTNINLPTLHGQITLRIYDGGIFILPGIPNGKNENEICIHNGHLRIGPYQIFVEQNDLQSSVFVLTESLGSYDGGIRFRNYFSLSEWVRYIDIGKASALPPEANHYKIMDYSEYSPSETHGIIVFLDGSFYKKNVLYGKNVPTPEERMVGLSQELIYKYRSWVINLAYKYELKNAHEWLEKINKQPTP